jgi:hypothetical protein
MEQPSPPLSKFTFAGRMLLLAHLLLGIGGTALYICDFIPRMPAGRYPVIMFVVPVGLVCFFSFLTLAWILERVGVRIYKR